MMKTLLNFFFLIAFINCLNGQGVKSAYQFHKISAAGTFYSFARISPDGKHIAVSFRDYEGIALLDNEGNATTTVTDGDGAGWNFVWSPDSRKIATRINYWTDREKQSSIAVYELQSKKFTEMKRTNWVSLPFWSTNGSYASYFEENAGWKSLPAAKSSEPVFVIQDSSVRMLYESDTRYDGLQKMRFKNLVLNFAFSPDRKKIAVEVLGEGLFVYDCAENKLYDLGMGEFPSWTDNEHIVYMYAKSSNSVFYFSNLIYQRFDGREYTNLSIDFPEIILYPGSSNTGVVVFTTLKGEVYKLQLNGE